MKIILFKLAFETKMNFEKTTKINCNSEEIYNKNVQDYLQFIVNLIFI